MTTIARALWSESLKLRRTLAFRMAFIAPLIVVFLQLMLLLQRGDAFLKPGDNPWFALRHAIGLWSALMLPLFVTLEAALVAGLEHGTKQWKHLFALPAPRWSVYVAKIAACLALTAIATVVLGVGILAGGFVMRLFRPDLTGGPPPFLLLARQASLAFLAAWLMLAVQAWVSLRWSSFTVAVAVGMSATVAGFMVGQSGRWGPLYPWSLPLHVLTPGRPIASILTLSLAGGLIVMALGCWDVTRRDVL